MSRRGNRSSGVAALLAGFGTGYLQGQKIKSDDERQQRRDKREEKDQEIRMEANRILLEKQARENQQELDVASGLDQANSMRVGQGVTTKTGAPIDTSESAWKQRAIEQGADESTATEAAKVYAAKSAETGADRWMDNSLDFGKGVRTTSQADIVRAQGTALAKGNRQDRMAAIELNNKADKLDLENLKVRIANGTPESLAKEYDDIFPDGLSLKFETGKDGKLYKFTEDASGKRSNYQTFADMDQFKQQLMALVDKDPGTIQQYWKESREIDRQNKKDTRDEKLSDIQIKKYQQDIDEGKIKLESLPEATRLELEGKRANIRQSNAATDSSRANTAKTNEEVKASRAGGSNDKLPTSVREALWYQQASPEQKAAFDKMNDKSPKVTSDGVGGFIINKPDGLYRMDDSAKVTKINMSEEKPKPENRKPLSAFMK